MPQPIYLPDEPRHPLSRIANQMTQMFMQMGLNKQRQGFLEKQAQEKKDYDKKVREEQRAYETEFEPEIPESMKGKVGIIQTGRGKYKVVDLTKGAPYKVGTVQRGVKRTNAKGKDVTVDKIYTGKGKTGWETIEDSEAKRYKPPGVNITNVIGQEKLRLQKDAFLGSLRLEITNANSEEVYRAKAPQYNRENKSNEVLYWDTKWKNEVKSVKIPTKIQAKVLKGAKEGVSASGAIQDAADRAGISVEEVLKKLGLIK